MSQTVSLIIPAYNEAETIGEIVRIARESKLFEEIVVVNDGSLDNTDEEARKAGAKVVSHITNMGKSQAMKTGVDNTSGEFVCFLDADLINLDIKHLWELTHPVVTSDLNIDATIGIINTFAQMLFPLLSGQRCLRRNLLDNFDKWDAKFGLEVALNCHLHRQGINHHRIYWWGVSQVRKEKKRGFVRGFMSRLYMYKQIVWAYIKELQRQ